MVKKRLKMDAEVYVEKSFEEVLGDFKNIRNSYCNKLCGDNQIDFGYDRDDIDNICSLYIWKAYETYNIETNVSFPHYLEMVLQRGVNTDMRKFRRNPEGYESLNKPIKSKMDYSDCELQDFIQDDNLPDEKVIVELLCIHKVMDDSPELHRQVFDEIYLQEMDRREVEKKHDISNHNVYYITKKMKGKMMQ